MAAPVPLVMANLELMKAIVSPTPFLNPPSPACRASVSLVAIAVKWQNVESHN